jgi:protein ImuB
MPILCVLFTEPVATWEPVLDVLDSVSPLVEDGGDGLALLEMRGIEGPPARWFAATTAALAGTPAFSLGLGPNKFVARAAAIAGDRTVIVTHRQARTLLAPLPLSLLELDKDVEARLHLLGILTLGELAALPHGPFVRRFGPEAARWHDRARGIDDRPFISRARALRIERTLFGEGTAEREEQILFALRTVTAQVANDLAAAGKRCGFLRLVLECENGDVHEVMTTVAEPTSQPPVLFDLMRARLEGIRLEAPVTGLRLSAERLENGGVPFSLFAQRDPDPQALSVALARIEATLGAQALRARIIDGNRPESRVAYEPFLTAPSRTLEPEPSLAALTPLQYRMLELREIDVVIEAHVPRLVGTPPQPVVHVCGPWRVDETWWDAPLRRDDYDVLLEDGSLYRIACRDGHWYLCGVYD